MKIRYCAYCKKNKLNKKQIKFCSRSCLSHNWSFQKRKQLSDSLKRYYIRNGGFSSEHKKNMSKSHSTPEYIKKWVIPFTRAGLSITESSIEHKVKNYLIENKIEFSKHYLIDRYFPDFVLEKQRLIIECDGDYWHRNTKEKDKMKDKCYEENGYQTLRLREKEINEDFDNCKVKIQESLKNLYQKTG